MGRNSKQRRDARRRQQPGRPQPRTGGAGGSDGRSPFGGGGPADWADVRFEPRAVVDLHVSAAVRRLGRRAVDPDQRERAEALLRQAGPLPASLVHESLDDLATQVVASVTAEGWWPDDLAELLRRRGVAAVEAALPALARLLDRAARRVGDPDPSWRAQLDAWGPRAPGRSTDVEGLAATLWLAGTLAGLPSLPPMVAPTDAPRGARRTRAAERTVDPERARKLATVRALLAKAESSAFDEEAEAFSAKAQELISRYALEQILEAAPGAAGAAADPVARRIWIDAPYVLAKAQLIHEVAQANRCRAVLSEPPGVSTVVGLDRDIDAVELLVTSLLVQGNAAMRRHGQTVDLRGASRTRSFRQSFLTSYAVHIGQRLRRSAEQALHDTGEEGRLLPVLRSQEETVVAAFEALVPDTIQKSSTVSNGAGWVAGQVAADLAVLDLEPSLDPARDAG